MHFFNEILNEEVDKIKQEIRDLDSELKTLKYDAKIDNEKTAMKLETVEKTNLEVINEMNDKENSVFFNVFLIKYKENSLKKLKKSLMKCALLLVEFFTNYKENHRFFNEIPQF